MKLDSTAAPVGSIESKDQFAVAPPGYGLTSDNSRWPWGNPPNVVDPKQALDEAVLLLKGRRPKELMKLLMVGASIESLVEGYIPSFRRRLQPGRRYSIKAPLAMYIANMAEEESIPYRFFENDDELTKDEMSDETFFTMLKENNPGLFSFVREQINEGIRQGNMPDEVEENSFLSSKEIK